MKQIDNAPDEAFLIEHNGSEYVCVPMEVNGRLLFKINFGKSYLYVTKGVSARGEDFWACVPEDLKLKQLVRQIGEQIENHYL
jgi:hypothetical protein